MWRTILIQAIALFAGLAGIYLKSDATYQWVLALLVALAALAAIAVAWSEKESKAFISRALESLILSSRPNDLALKRAISALNAAGKKRGYPRTKVCSFANGSVLIRFFDTKNDGAGVLSLPVESIARLSIQSESRLAGMADEPFSSRTSGNLRSRNELVDEISLAAVNSLGEQGVQILEWCVWVDDERIAVPVCPPNRHATERGRVTFPATEFESLNALSSFELHTLVQTRVLDVLSAATADAQTH
jgi:hypothetical protein